MITCTISLNIKNSSDINMAADDLENFNILSSHDTSFML